MFAITIVFLVAVAIALHTTETDFWFLHGPRIGWLLVLLYPLYPLEAFLHWLRGERGLRQNLLFCLIPLARFGGRDHVDQRHVWLPVVGWQTVNRTLAHQVMRYFSIPMIVIALLVVPVIIFELFFDELLLAHAGLKLAVDATSAFIWASFVFEFVLVVSIVERPMRYCRQNWINIAVIVLPAIAFLRVIQIGRLIALKQLVRTTRVFRLRGILFRAWRAVVTLDVIDMLLRRNPSVRLERTKDALQEKLEEIEILRQEIAQLEKMIAEAAAEEEMRDEPATGEGDIVHSGGSEGPSP